MCMILLKRKVGGVLAPVGVVRAVYADIQAAISISRRINAYFYGGDLLSGVRFSKASDYQNTQVEPATTRRAISIDIVL